MSPTSHVRVQFFGKVVDMPIVLLFFDMVALVPVVQVQLLRLGPDRGVVPQIMEEIVKVSQSSFLLYSYGVLTASCGTCLDVVFWLSVTELSLAQITGR